MGAIAIEWQKALTPQRPSVAVLPFANLSGDPSQDYFADGISDALITDLAKLSGLDVIARNSVSAYKGSPVVLADVARNWASATWSRVASSALGNKPASMRNWSTRRPATTCGQIGLTVARWRFLPSRTK